LSARRGQRAGLRIILALAAVLVGCIAILQVWRPSRPDRHVGRPPRGQTARRLAPAPPHAPRSAPASPGDGSRGETTSRVSVVIDDVGFDEELALEFGRLGLPMTFAVLPHQRYSEVLASRLRAMGHEVILHLPMQPLAWPVRDPGEGAVTEGLSAAQIRAVVLGDLAAVPGAVGLNNHMGSRATTDPVLMRSVLDVARDRGLFFLDSRTTTGTVAYDLAIEMGVPAVRRSVFLDDRRERSYIEAQVRSLLERARSEGSALAIGHPDAATLEALRRSEGLLRSPDIRMVPASSLAETDGPGAG
jgi:polysaccharide deacetylase 2 family uncharacterized protein YibQ